jgi:hypothetical protein
MTTLSRGSHRDAEAPVHTATHVAAPAPTGTEVPAVPWPGPASSAGAPRTSSAGAARASLAGAARASAARFPWTAKSVITAPAAARHRAVPLTWNLTQATDWTSPRRQTGTSRKRQAGTSGKRN